jgi:hypothetical protein
MSDRAYADVGRDLAAKMEDAAEAEAEYQHTLLARAQPSEPKKLDAGQNAMAMLAVPIIGMTIADTMRNLAESRKDTIRRTVQAGFVNNQTADEILRTLRGTKGANYTDGLFNRSRIALETTVRTAIGHAVEYTSAAFHALNSDIVRAVVWLSVLDSATSSWCIARAGKRYTADAAHKPIGHNYDWGAGPGRYHYNCRSTFAPLVAGEVPNANRFADWLKKQPAKVQDEVLGPTRGKMYRSGQVSVEGFLNNKGKLLTLEQLKAKNGGLPL